jgi:hypothetical protein
MPLAFTSKTHGVVAFGFFNIECELLLLERRFFFAEDFCRVVGELADAEGEVAGASLPGWSIADPSQMGDLRGAIRGTDLRGFIGATYARHPFPSDPKAFHQSPKGALDREEATALVNAYGTREEIALVWGRTVAEVRVADVVFDEARFGELLAYVRRGGYPRWRDDAPPGYVLALLARLEASAPSFAPSTT